MLKGILQTELFYCNHLGVSESDEQDIMRFTVRDEKGAGLLDYIQFCAFSDEDTGNMRTYVVRDARSAELVGYFSLKAGLISYNEHDIDIIDEDTGEKKTRRIFDTIPGVELADFAINQTYISHHPNLKGVGLVVFQRFILPIIRQAADMIGIRILYIFALPYDELISRYEDYGFSRLPREIENQLHSRIKPQYDDQCIFMYRGL